MAVYEGRCTCITSFVTCPMDAIFVGGSVKFGWDFLERGTCVSCGLGVSSVLAIDPVDIVFVYYMYREITRLVICNYNSMLWAIHMWFHHEQWRLYTVKSGAISLSLFLSHSLWGHRVGLWMSLSTLSISAENDWRVVKPSTWNTQAEVETLAGCVCLLRTR